jgi:hypothetical protein
MATVTGYTAQKMKQIEDSTVNNAELVGGELILYQRDGTPINVGSVIGEGVPGPPGPTSIVVCTSGTRPGSPTEGLFIYETDTDRVYSYNGAAWVERGLGVILCTAATRPTVTFEGMRIYETDTNLDYIHDGTNWLRYPWKAPWGYLASQTLPNSSPVYSTSTNTDMVLTVPVRNDRAYRINLSTTITMAAGGCWGINCSAGGTVFNRFFVVNQSLLFGEQISSSVLYLPATTASTVLRVVATEVYAGTTITFNASSPTLPRNFWIEDIGPRVP